jgi:hypothetical protein
VNWLNEGAAERRTVLDGPHVVSALMRVLDRHHAGRAGRVPADGRGVRVLSLPRPWEDTDVPAAPCRRLGRRKDGPTFNAHGTSAGAPLAYRTLR